MKLPSLPSRLSPLLTLLVLTGCNSAYREAFSRAKDAAIRGDFVSAARGYRDACAAAPDDKDACGRLPTFVQKGTDQAIASATPACEVGDLDHCLPQLLDGKDLSPDHPMVNSMLEKASVVHTERCAKWDDKGPVSTAVAGLACLQARGHQLPVPSYQALLTQRAQGIASRLSGLAATANQQGTQGAAAVLLSAAQCLAPETGVGQQAQQARGAFYAQSAIPVDARISGSVPRRIAAGLEDLCPRLSSGLPPWARCVENGAVNGQPDPLQLQVDAVIQRVQATVSENVDQVKYVKGQRWVLNPRFVEVERELRRADKALEAAEKEKAEKDSACAKAQKEHEASCVGCPDPGEKKKAACDAALQAGVAYANNHSVREEVRKTLAATPERLSEDVWDTFTYSVMTHHWSSGYSFNLTSNTPGANQAGQSSGVLAFEDREHVGFEPARLVADPLVVPPDQAFSDAFLHELTPHLMTALQRDAQARAAARQAQCSTLPANWSPSWVQCWAEAALWGNGAEPPPHAFLQVLASSTGATEQPLCR